MRRSRPRERRSGVVGAGAALVSILLSAASPVLAQGEDDARDPFINFAYAAQLGAGVYRVGDIDLATIKLPIRVNLRDGRGEGEAPDRWSLILKAPITVGHYTARDEFDGLEFFQSADAVSFIPGVMAKVPLATNWVLKPSFDAGYGHDFDNSLSAVLLSAGVGSIASWPAGASTFSLGNQVVLASNIPTNDASSLFYGLVRTGFDFEFDRRFRTFGRDNTFSVYALSMFFMSDFDFGELLPPAIGGDRPGNTTQWEIGFSYGSVDDPIKILKFFPLRRIGLGYRFGENFSGVRIVTGFPF